MLSRVADSLFWMSRYIERTDGILRMLKINYASSQDSTNKFSWKPVLEIFSPLDHSPMNQLEKNSRAVLQFMVVDKENPNSVLNMVTRSRENARAVQDHITIEMWQCLNEFYHIVRDERLSKSLLWEDPVTVLDSLIKQCMLYYGNTEVTMSQGEGMCFMNIGRYLERAIQSTDFLQVKFKDLTADEAKMTDPFFWKYFLLSISGYELYLKNYRSGFEAKNIIDQIIFNINFPRSVHHSVYHAQLHFEQLKNERNRDGYDKVNFIIGKLRSQIKFSNVESILKEGLPVYLDKVHHELVSVGNALNQHYFAYS